MTGSWEPSSAGRCGGDLTIHRCPELGQDSWAFQPCVDQALGAGPLGRGSAPRGGGFLSGGSPGGGEGGGLVLPPRAGDGPLIPGGGWGPNLVD